MNCKNCGKEIEENSKFCNECGASVEEATVGKNADQSEIIQTETASQQSNIKKKISVKQIVSVCCSVILIIILLSNFLDLETGGKTTKEYDNDSGAVISMTFEDFCKEFDSSYDDVEKSDKFDDMNFGLMECWNEPEEDTDESETAYLYYKADIEESRINATVYDNHVSSISFDFNLYDTDDIEFASALAVSAIMAGGDMNYDNANNIFKNVVEYNVVIYKNGLLFYCSDYGYFVIKAASESYVQAMNVRGISVNEW